MADCYSRTAQWLRWRMRLRISPATPRGLTFPRSLIARCMHHRTPRLHSACSPPLGCSRWADECGRGPGDRCGECECEASRRRCRRRPCSICACMERDSKRPLAWWSQASKKSNQRSFPATGAPSGDDREHEWHRYVRARCTHQRQRKLSDGLHFMLWRPFARPGA